MVERAADGLAAVEAAVAGARPGEGVEGFFSRAHSVQVAVRGGAVESISTSETRGLSVRVVAGSRIGTAFTNDLTGDGIRVVLEDARANMRATAPDASAAIAPGWERDVPPVPDLFAAPGDEGDPVALALSLETAAARDPLVFAVAGAGFGESRSETAVATSTGIAAAYERSDAWCHVTALARDGDGSHAGFALQLERSRDRLRPEDVAATAARRAGRMVGATSALTGDVPVVFGPRAAGQFLQFLGRAVNGANVQEGRSILAGSLGHAVCAPHVGLVDDGRAGGAPGSAPWDVEGVPSRRTEVVREGTLVSFLYDVATARRDGRTSTGNASRSDFRYAVKVSPTNLAFVPTGEDVAAVLARGEGGLLVDELQGIRGGAGPTATFTAGATGRSIRGGTPGAPVTGVVLAAPMDAVLSGIEAVADDREWMASGGSYGGATTFTGEMTVTGR